MGINLLTIVLEWDPEEERYVQKKKEINPNLKQDIADLEEKIKQRIK